MARQLRFSSILLCGADHVIKAIKDRNSEAAKMAYLEMTTTCFAAAGGRGLGDISFEPAGQ